MALHSISDSKNVRFERGTRDLRNFEVRGRASKEKMGIVDDVLVDENGRARYLCVSQAGSDRHSLIPVGAAETDSTNKMIWVPAGTSLSNVPSYSHKPSTIDEDYERRVSSAWDQSYTPETFHERPEYQAGTWGRGRESRDSGKLQRLDKLTDYKVADGDPDPRGWKFVGRDGKTLGEVDHLIGDTGSMRVRYLTVKLDREIDSNRRDVLVPTGHIDLDTKRNRVIARGFDRNCMVNMPAYTGQEITRDIEQKVSTACEAPYTGEARYEHPRYRDDRLWSGEERISRSEEELKVGTRERKTGEVDVKKHVETEHVRKPVTTHHEEVDVERRPATGQSRAEFGDREVRVPVNEEEVVVEKRPRVKEEIVVRKRDVADTEWVEEDVRKEKVDVEKVDVDDRRPPR